MPQELSVAIEDHAAAAHVFERLAVVANLFGARVSGIVISGSLNEQQQRFAAAAIEAATSLRELAREEYERHLREIARQRGE